MSKENKSKRTTIRKTPVDYGIPKDKFHVVKG